MDKYLAASRAQHEQGERLMALESRLAALGVSADDKDARIAQLEQLVAQLDANSREQGSQHAQQRERDQAALARLAAQYEQALETERRRSAEAAAQAEKGLAEAERRKGEEMGQLEARMRQMFARKDEQIAGLREQVASKEMRVRQIEALLERQRQELVGGL